MGLPSYQVKKIKIQQCALVQGVDLLAIGENPFIPAANTLELFIKWTPPMDGVRRLTFHFLWFAFDLFSCAADHLQSLNGPGY